MSTLNTNNATITNTNVGIFYPNTTIEIDENITTGNVTLAPALLTVGNVSITPTALNTPQLFVGGSLVGIPKSGIISYQEFTANGTWYNPYNNASINSTMTNSETVLMLMWGAGGSGSQGGGDDGAGGGGACVISTLPLSSFTSTCAVTVGNGVASFGVAGQNTTFVVNGSVTVTAYAGGGSGGADDGGGGGGWLSAGSGITGGNPLPSATSTFGGGAGTAGGDGGTSIFGGGGAGDAGNVGGNTVFGGGGGGDGGAGTSVIGGRGGTSAASPTTPGGGGGAGGTRYIGARGEVRVWVIGPYPRVTAPSLGSFYQGGYYVGSISISGMTYGILVSPKADQSASLLAWKTTNTSSPGTDSLVDGLTNSSAMFDANHPAAQYCMNLVSGGYSDWYLPSRDELNLIWINRTSLPSGQTHDAAGYWSSSEFAADSSWRQNFADGTQLFDNLFPKTAVSRVRAVRRFIIT